MNCSYYSSNGLKLPDILSKALRVKNGILMIICCWSPKRDVDTAVIKTKRVKFNSVLTVPREECLLMEIPLKANVSTDTQIIQYPHDCD